MYEIKKVLEIDNNLSLEECKQILVSDEFCLGILDDNREIYSFVILQDLEQALKFDIAHYSINLISTQADVLDVDVKNIDTKKLKNIIAPGLNKGVFVGKGRKNIKELILDMSKAGECKEKFLTSEYEENIPEDIKKALELCTQAADKISLPIFLIGGVVRDIIAGKQCFDVDITVEENAIEFSKFLRKEYPQITKIKEVHHEFRTAKIQFNINNKVLELDIASTRKETYPYPASLPLIQEIGCSIYEDIVRRDFTINSMALSLNKSSFCKLIDPFCAYDDLLNRVIKILHPLSFVDDPTRIIRALKFAVRFNLNPDCATEKLQKACISSGLFDGLAGERVKSEIRQTFNLNKAECLDKFVRDKIYLLISKNISFTKVDISSAKCESFITEYKDYISSESLIWLIYLGTLICECSWDEILDISGKLYLSGFETEILLGAKSILKKINKIKESKTRFEVYEHLEGYLPESVLISLINTTEEAAVENIKLFLKELQNIKIYTTGKTLIESGLIPGPVFGEIMRELLLEKINGNITTKQDELDYIKGFVADRLRN